MFQKSLACLKLKSEKVPKSLFLPLHVFALFKPLVLCFGFYEQIRMKRQMPVRWPGSQPAWPGHALCVCFCAFPSLMANENPNSLETGKNET